MYFILKIKNKKWEKNREIKLFLTCRIIIFIISDVFIQIKLIIKKKEKDKYKT